MSEARLLDAAMKLLVLIFSLSLHEYGHALAATRLGDPTAKMLGRLTLDPRPHIDPMGTIVFPLLTFLFPGFFLFGWAKPVPVTVANLGHPRRDGALVALAGPAMNLLLALLAYGAFRLLGAFSFFGMDPSALGSLLPFLSFFLWLNLVLALFNLIPVHPLDGSWILKSVLPPRWSYRLSRLDPYGFLILFGLFYLLRF